MKWEGVAVLDKVLRRVTSEDLIKQHLVLYSFPILIVDRLVVSALGIWTCVRMEYCEIVLW